MHCSSLRADKEICPGYQLGRLRGRGAFGSVWEGQTESGHAVALKFLPCGDDLTAAQEIRSIQVVRQLRHPNLVRIDQVWCHRGYVVITMELADGSLFDLLEAYQHEYGTSLTPHDVCYYLGQAAQALDFLNTRRVGTGGQRVSVQHCDVKPTNLLLFGETVKLSDFGVSALTSSPVRAHRRAGTLAYAAPEVFQGRLSDWTDQYSLAITYCHLRGGRLPFADTPRSFSAAYQRPAPDLSMLSEPERPIIARGLALAPQDRWPTCAELMGRLTEALG